MSKSIPVKDLELNENNPRTLRDSRLEDLCLSLVRFAPMLFLDPIYHKDKVVQSGNQRLTAVREVINRGMDFVKEHQLDKHSQSRRDFNLKFWSGVIETGKLPYPAISDIEEKKATTREKAFKGLSLDGVFGDDELKEFLIKSNISFGDWDYTQMGKESEWQLDELTEWGYEPQAWQIIEEDLLYDDDEDEGELPGDDEDYQEHYTPTATTDNYGKVEIVMDKDKRNKFYQAVNLAKEIYGVDLMEDAVFELSKYFIKNNTKK